MSLPARDKFQVGWICALPEEVAAATEMLDEKFGTLDDQDRNDTNSYTLGRMDKHYVVIAGLGIYGTTSAAVVAINMSRTFSKSLRIGLMVGIAGGIPSANFDIRLGDIVVSSPVAKCGGVIQYDMGKVGKDGKLVQTGSLNAPPRSLLTAMANIRAATMTNDPKYLGYIEKALHRNKRTQKTFGRPHMSSDRLFRSDHEHPEMAPTCEGCLPEWEQPRQPREEDETQVHYGIIASGNAVIKHAATRDQLGRETGALCFEMEAAGLMMDFPCVVVRGICDYADSHKNKKWQGYAALVAAAYAKELLSYVPSGCLDTEKLVMDVCQNVSRQLEEVNKGIELAFRQRDNHHRENTDRVLSQELQECHQAFKTSTYEAYKNFNPMREEDTCRWVLDNIQYHHWRDSGHHDLLWISADPGCGKSVLARSLVDRDLASFPSVSICYFFFKDNEDQDSLATALCALLHQLFGRQQHLLRHALVEWRMNGTKIKKEVDILWRILNTAVSDEAFTSTVFILDALDECQAKDQQKLVDKLSCFYTERHSVPRQNWLKFLVTSRPYVNIQNGFRPVTESFPQIRIRGEEENDQIHKEINLIIKIRVEQLAREVGLVQETRQQLEHQLLGMKHRTYLWLHLAMEDIRIMLRMPSPTQNIAPNFVNLIPKSVDAAYEKIIKRVPRDARKLVKATFQIIVCAWRPLTIQELAIALGAAMSTGWRSAVSAKLESRGLAEKIRQLCGLFVFISSSERVFLMHQTAREFLIKNQTPDGREWPPRITATHKYEDAEEHLLLEVGKKKRKWYHTTRAEAHFLMLRVCLMFITADRLDNARLYANPPDEDGRLKARSFKEPLEHQANCPFDGLSQTGVLHHAVAIYPAQMNAVYDLIFHTKDAVPALTDIWLLCVCRFGLIKTTEMLIHNGADLEYRDCSGFTPLMWAVRRNDKSLAKLLIGYGSEMEASHYDIKTPLVHAVRNDQQDMVRLLVGSGADIEKKDYSGMTPLIWAIVERRTDMAKLLIELGADIQTANALHCKTPLLWATETGQETIVALLLELGAHIDVEDLFEDTPLMTAVEENRKDIAKLLIECGACLETRNCYGEGLLMRAFENGNKDMARLLIESGADVKAQTMIVDERPLQRADLELQQGVAKWLHELEESIAEEQEPKRTKLEVSGNARA